MLVAHKEENGDCSVSANCPQDKEFGRWVAAQRELLLDGRLRKHRERRLRKIGFPFFPRDDQWLVFFDELIEYKKTNGDCLVSRQNERVLGIWVHKQGRAHKKGNLNEMMGSELKRYDMLKDIGFIFDLSKGV